MDLQTLLSRIPWTHHFKMDFTATLDNRVQKTITPVYALPGEMFEGFFCAGFYTSGSGLELYPVGLSQQRDFVTKYYHLKESRKWEEEAQRDDVYYVPLELTAINLSLYGKRGFYKIYTVQGLPYKFPLLFVEERSEEGTLAHGFYQNDKGMVKRFSYPVNSTTWCKYLSDLENGAYSFTHYGKDADKIITSEKARKSSAAKKKEEVDDWPIKWEEPQSIKEYLDQHVVEQDHAKKVLSVAFSNYYLEQKTKQKLPRNPVLLIGPTGVGKTLMASLLAKKAGLPFGETALPLNSGVGFVGGDISDGYKQIRAKTTEPAPYGIFFGDELDKVARRGTGTWGITLMDELVSQIEGKVIELDYGNNKRLSFDTRNILFIFAGAFHENQDMLSLTGIISRRLRGDKKVGCGVDHDKGRDEINLLEQVAIDDLIKYGLKRELVGRLAHRAVLQKLTRNNLVEIIKKSKSSPLLGYRELFAEKGYALQVEENAYDALAAACPQETGARSLHDVCSRVFLEIIYDPKVFAHDEKIVLSADLIEKLLPGSAELKTSLGKSENL